MRGLVLAHQEKWLVLVLPYELKHFVGDGFRSVGFAAQAAGVAFEGTLFPVIDKILGKEIVGVALTVESVETVEALVERIAGGARFAQAPLAEGAGRVADFLQDLGDGDVVFAKGELAAVAVPGSDLEVVADVGVTAVTTGHERAARRGADWRTGVMLGEAHTFRRHLVEMRRLDLLLTVAAELRVAEVIGHDIDDVRLAGRVRGCRGK